MRHAFNLIELMIVMAIMAIIAAIAIPQLMAKREAMDAAAPTNIEAEISIAGMHYVRPGFANVIVLPTGERVLFVSNERSMAVCVLPPLPKPEGKVEK